MSNDDWIIILALRIAAKLAPVILLLGCVLCAVALFKAQGLDVLRTVVRKLEQQVDSLAQDVDWPQFHFDSERTIGDRFDWLFGIAEETPTGSLIDLLDLLSETIELTEGVPSRTTPITLPWTVFQYAGHNRECKQQVDELGYANVACAKSSLDAAGVFLIGAGLVSGVTPTLVALGFGLFAINLVADLLAK